MYKILFTLSLFFISFYSHANVIDSVFTKDKWIPDAINLQFAGNIGMLSTGIRYNSPNEKWQGSLMYGFVPRNHADKAIHAFTLKGNYIPLKKQLNHETKLDLIKIGLWYNYALGKEYFRKLPDYYDSGYYYFPTAVNIGLTIGSEVKYKKLGFYYELGTTDKTVINFAKSPNSIDFYELWNLGIGITYHLK